MLANGADSRSLSSSLCVSRRSRSMPRLIAPASAAARGVMWLGSSGWKPRRNSAWLSMAAAISSCRMPAFSARGPRNQASGTPSPPPSSVSGVCSSRSQAARARARRGVGGGSEASGGLNAQSQSCADMAGRVGRHKRQGSAESEPVDQDQADREQHQQREGHRQRDPGADPGEHAHIDAEPERGHRHHGQQRRRSWSPGQTAASGIAPSERSAASPRKPRMNHGTSLPKPSRPVGPRPLPRPLAAAGARAAEQPTTTGPEHQHPHELHQRADLGADHADRQRGRQHLRHGIDGQAGQHAVLVLATFRASGTNSGRPSTTSTPSTAVNAIEAATSRGFGADHRRDRSDRGIAADRVAARDQDRHPRRQPQQAAKPKLARERHGDGAGDAAISSAPPEATMAPRLIEAPSSATAASSSCLALNAIPACEPLGRATRRCAPRCRSGSR